MEDATDGLLTVDGVSRLDGWRALEGDRSISSCHVVSTRIQRESRGCNSIRVYSFHIPMHI
jgi:hypothetical protein